jgi:hypothetical protein
MKLYLSIDKKKMIVIILIKVIMLYFCESKIAKKKMLKRQIIFFINWLYKIYAFIFALFAPERYFRATITKAYIDNIDISRRFSFVANNFDYAVSPLWFWLCVFKALRCARKIFIEEKEWPRKPGLKRFII